MKKNYVILAAFALSFSMMGCSGADDKKDAKTEAEEEMTIDEKELEEEFEKLDEDVEKMDTVK
ncbi:MAG: hypothetical protein K0R65_1756 [Crocinitomicaceae bacterium]|jgi:hypothetical protein|nr:hypothetical protein [Crocinitomicaceae bacterium]